MTTILAIEDASARQNAHLTFKQNLRHGRHGWLRLTPAYSVKLVDQILSSSKYGVRVLDPFSGTGTTALCASYLGMPSTGLELNPFLVWFSTVKSRQYAPATIAGTRILGSHISSAASSLRHSPAAPPPIHNIERWWNIDELQFLCRLKASINKMVGTDCEERNLLLVAFCRTVIQLSNAAFNHQSMSFKKTEPSPHLFISKEDHAARFQSELSIVLAGAADNPCIQPNIVCGDARKPSQLLTKKYDLVITSPPYPNRMSYIRELRPYMYWLNYLSNGRDAGELDWQAIGGTWGIATSRLSDWKSSGNSFVPLSLKKALAGISRPENSNGKLLANYVEKYFEDMWHHIMDISSILEPDGEMHYIVGNSKFYGTVLPVQEIYKDMFIEAGFNAAEIYRIRKRNSKAELYEYDVVASRGGTLRRAAVHEAGRESRGRKKNTRR